MIELELPLRHRVRHGVRRPDNWMQLLRFVAVGGSGYVVNLLVFAACVHLLSIDYRLAQHDLILKLLSKISEEDRSLILLKEVEGHSVEELAGMTGLNENTIKVKLFRTRQKLIKAASRLTRTKVFGK